ncbi:DUF1490 family protein [Amycolatopsis sp. FDAARGOS 1241]|nr:DUF1490 family protein [Amycolatopsis sp. FDAARGOS 1241]
MIVKTAKVVATGLTGAAAYGELTRAVRSDAVRGATVTVTVTGTGTGTGT